MFWEKKKMPKYQGYLIRKEYFKVEVEADSWEDARDAVLDSEVGDEPVDIDWDVYDLEEIA
jgi:hypothetical protein